MTSRISHVIWSLTSVAFLALAPPAQAQSLQTPERFFGFEIGTDGELARYPRVVAYLKHLADNSDRVMFEERGTTTLGNPYVLVTFSSRENLKRLDRLVEINHRLADPRGLPEADAMRLAREGVPFYFLFATIHSTEVGNGQAIIEIAHRMATDDGAEIQQILDNTVLLLVPSQNPDGQVLVIDHWYNTQGTPYTRTYPDLYHHYVGHDNNRDWFMFTQTETRLAVQVHTEYKPQVTHDMHQMESSGARIFVPPFQEPYDPNIHPILAAAQAQIGLAMTGALLAEGKGGVIFDAQYDLWTPSRQYMVYHGQPRILTEVASARLADPYINPAGKDRPLGPQQTRSNFPKPYDTGIWRLRDIVDYGLTAVFAGIGHLAKYRTTSLENFYKVHRDWVERDEAPSAFVIPANQRDPFETYELLEILDVAEVEIHQARAAFSAGGRRYPAGSWVIQLAQPYGAFAKTMLETQDYPDLRSSPGGPPITPYDVTAQTLGMLMGVEVHQIDEPVTADLDLLGEITPPPTPAPPRPGWAYLISPGSNAGFLALSRLQEANIPVFRAAERFESGGRPFAPGTWIGPPQGDAGRILQSVSQETGLVVSAADRAPGVGGYRMKMPTRVGLWRAANNMPAGWMMWLFEQYEFNHDVISSIDFQGDLSATYDVIVLPSGTSPERMVQGLNPQRHDETWRWAYGVGTEGWNTLARWVRDGGTLVAIGTAVQTARQLLDLPIESVLPHRDGRGGGQQEQLNRRLGGVDPTSVFYSPGSLLKQEYDIDHPVAYGMPASWPVFFRNDQAYRLRPSFDTQAEVVSRYPDDEVIVASGWLLGDEFLRDQANVISFKVGSGSVVTLGSQVDFRTQTRGTFKLIFNAMFQGPATKVNAEQLSRLSTTGETQDLNP